MSFEKTASGILITLDTEATRRALEARQRLKERRVDENSASEQSRKPKREPKADLSREIPNKGKFLNVVA